MLQCFSCACPSLIKISLLFDCYYSEMTSQFNPSSFIDTAPPFWPLRATVAAAGHVMWSVDGAKHGSSSDVQTSGQAGAMDHRPVDRVGILSPLEESSAEISRDSGIVSQSASSLSMVSDILSSGTVSQSPSFGAAAAANVVPQSPSVNVVPETETADQDDEVLRHTALRYSSYIRATAGDEVGLAKTS